MASPARPATASVSGAFGLAPDAAASRCSFDQARRREGFQDNRLMKSFVNICERESYSKEIIIAAVESCMKKQVDGLLHSLEGISGRLSQLELYCYKLERSIGELRSDVMDYHSEANLNFRCLGKNLQEVQKSVQGLKDKQELADTRKELTRFKIAHEDPVQKNEGCSPSMLVTRENDDMKHELSLVPLHQVNAMQSPTMQFQSGNGILQHLVPVSLSTQEDQQHLNQANVYYMQSQSLVEHTQTQPSQPAFQSARSQIQNPQESIAVELPQKTSQALELYPQPQQQWPQLSGHQFQLQAQQSQPQVVQHQQYNIHQVPQQMVQLPTSSPQAQSTPQVMLLYPAYGSHQLVGAPMDQPSRNMVVQPSYSTMSSPHRKHQEVTSPVYDQGSTVTLPLAKNDILHEQPQPLQPLNHSLLGPQPSKRGHCSVASYTVQGNAQTYGTTYGNPSNSSATVVAVLPQQTPVSAPMVFQHLGPQPVQNHPFGEMVEKAAEMGWPGGRVENMTFRMVTIGQPVDSSHLLDKLNTGNNVATPQAWSG